MGSTKPHPSLAPLLESNQLSLEKPASLKSFFSQSGRIVLSGPSLSDPYIQDLLKNYQESTVQGDLNGKPFFEAEVEKFSLGGHSQLGHYEDLLAHKMAKHGYDFISGRAALFLGVYYFSYLQTSRLSSYPFEVESFYGNEGMAIQISATVHGFSSEYIYDSFGVAGHGRPFNYLLQLLCGLVSCLDICFLKENNKVILTSYWSKQDWPFSALFLRNLEQSKTGSIDIEREKKIAYQAFQKLSPEVELKLPDQLIESLMGTDPNSHFYHSPESAIEVFQKITEVASEENLESDQIDLSKLEDILESMPPDFLERSQVGVSEKKHLLDMMKRPALSKILGEEINAVQVELDQDEAFQEQKKKENAESVMDAFVKVLGGKDVPDLFSAHFESDPAQIEEREEVGGYRESEDNFQATFANTTENQSEDIIKVSGQAPKQQKKTNWVAKKGDVLTGLSDLLERKDKLSKQEILNRIDLDLKRDLSTGRLPPEKYGVFKKEVISGLDELSDNEGQLDAGQVKFLLKGVKESTFGSQTIKSAAADKAANAQKKLKDEVIQELTKRQANQDGASSLDHFQNLGPDEKEEVFRAVFSNPDSEIEFPQFIQDLELTEPEINHITEQSKNREEELRREELLKRLSEKNRSGDSTDRGNVDQLCRENAQLRHQLESSKREIRSHLKVKEQQQRIHTASQASLHSEEQEKWAKILAQKNDERDELLSKLERGEDITQNNRQAIMAGLRENQGLKNEIEKLRLLPSQTEKRFSRQQQMYTNELTGLHKQLEVRDGLLKRAKESITALIEKKQKEIASLNDKIDSSEASS